MGMEEKEPKLITTKDLTDGDYVVRDLISGDESVVDTKYFKLLFYIIFYSSFCLWKTLKSWGD